MRQFLCLLAIFGILCFSGCRWHGVPVEGTLTLGIGEVRHDFGKKTDLRVMLAEGYRTQTVPLVWNRAEVTLSHPTLLGMDRSKTLFIVNSERSAAVFTTLRPGSGYTLTVKLYASETLKAQGTRISLTLAGGSNSVGVYLSTVLGDSLLTPVGTFKPPTGELATDWSASAYRVAVDAAGNLYLSGYRNGVLKVSSGQIAMFAGTGWYGYFGDSGSATNALFQNPQGLALDASGNLYLADAMNHRIRKVNSSGIVSTVAGNGVSGYGGDGGAATSAMLSAPFGVALDAAGNLYIADRDNHRVRKVDSAGIISTVAGNGAAGYGGDGGAATSAMLNAPGGVVTDASGSLYIADTGNSRVRKLSGGILTTVAGGGLGGLGDGGAATSATLGYVHDVAVDTGGNLYLVEKEHNRVRKVNPSGIISTVAGNGTSGFSGDGGAATSAQLKEPTGLAVDGSGNLFIADSNNYRVRKVTVSGTITTVVGNGKASCSGDGGYANNAQLNAPAGLLLDGSGNLYFADRDNHRVCKVSWGILTTIAGTGAAGYSGDGGPATGAKLNQPNDIALDAAGNLYIADRDNHRVRKVDPSGNISTVAGTGTGGFSGDGGAATGARINYPSGLALDAAGNLFIADCVNSRIRKVNPSGTISTVAGTGTEGYSGDGGPALDAQLNYPWDVAVDGSGNLYLSDNSNYVIRKVSGGTITTIAGSGMYGDSGDGGPATTATMRSPGGVALDASGNLYVADYESGRIRKVTPLGSITTVAGVGVNGYSGDSGSPTQTLLSQPSEIFVDGNGLLYVADSGNGRVRRIQ